MTKLANVHNIKAWIIAFACMCGSIINIHPWWPKLGCLWYSTSVCRMIWIWILRLTWKTSFERKLILVTPLLPARLLTCVTLSLMVGERCLRVVVVAMVVVVSIIVVDISARGVVEVVSVVSTEGTSPTSRRLPWVWTLGSPSAASLSTCSPL